MESIDTGTKVALALGAFGSLVGLLNFVLKAVEVWRDRSNIRLGITTGAGPIVGYGQHTVDLQQNVYITVANRGRRPLHVTSAGLLHKDRTSSPWMFDSLAQSVFPAVLGE